MTDIRKLLAANMKSFRKELGLSQAKLAELVDTAPRYITMIEGCKNFPSTDMLKRIAKALGKDTLDMFSMPSIHSEQREWKKEILADIEKLISEKLEALERSKEHEP